MRSIQADLERTLEKEKKMAFIAGPRQVGKTTLALKLLEESHSENGYFNWDNPVTRKKIIRNPNDFWFSPDQAPPRRIALDEIHKYPKWKRFLKGFYDTQRGKVEILVTGSGRLDVYQRGGDSLFGRYHLYHLMPYSLGELMGKNENLSPSACLKRVRDAPPSDLSENYQLLLKFNGFPEPLFTGEEQFLKRWQYDHSHLILREDLRDLSQIREIGLIESMIELLPDRVGSPLSVNSLREDLGVNFKTVQNWLKTLDRLYFLFFIRPFSGKLARTLKREEKVYFYDGSVLEDESKRLENMVALHLLKACFYWTDAGYGDFRLHYLRDKEKREVDFLVCEKGKPYLLVEVKLSETEIDKSLLYFQERLRPKHAFQVIGKAAHHFLTQKENGLILSSASRFLAALP